jgi:hypothetical protein
MKGHPKTDNVIPHADVDGGAIPTVNCLYVERVSVACGSGVGTFAVPWGSLVLERVVPEGWLESVP